MDEMNKTEDKKGFAIPPKKGMFDEESEMPIAETTFIKTVENEDGTKAVNVLGIETDEEGNFVAKLTDDEIETYGEGLLEGNPDDRGLQVGEIFEGETALSDAEAKADQLIMDFAPAGDATDEEFASAAMDAKGGLAEVDFSDIENEPVMEQIDKELANEEM